MCLQVNLANDHRYMAQIVSSAIVNAPPPEGVIKTLHVCSTAHKNIDKSTKVRRQHDVLPTTCIAGFRRTHCLDSCFFGALTAALLFSGEHTALTSVFLVFGKLPCCFQGNILPQLLFLLCFESRIAVFRTHCLNSCIFCALTYCCFQETNCVFGALKAALLVVAGEDAAHLQERACSWGQAGRQA